MKINELKPKTGNVDIVATVVNIDAPREFDKDGKKIKVVKATIKDETGDCKLTLWNEETEKIKNDDKIRITNGWADEYKGEMQVSAGKFGKIEVIEHDETIQEAIEQNKKEDKKDVNENIYYEDDEIVFDADDDDII